MKSLQSTLRIMEEFYAVIKLVSGEEIFSLISYSDDNPDDIILSLYNPVIIEPILGRVGLMGYKIRSWMNISNEDYYVIKMNSVITMTESKDKNLISIYNKFINSSSRVPLDSSMGFISTVDNAKLYLEDILSLS